MKKIKLFLITFFLFTSISSALTLSEIRTQIRLRIKDSNASRQRYTDAQINSLVNEAQRDVINASWIIYKQTNIELVPGTTYYLLPTDTIEIGRLTLRGVPLKEVSMQEQDGLTSSAWQNTSGTPTKYFQDSTQPGYIGFYPFPNSTSSTGTVNIQYIAQGETLSLDGDIPFNSENRYLSYHDTLVLYPCYKIFTLEGDLQKAQAYGQEYESRVVILRDRLRSKPNWSPSFSGGKSP